MKRPSLFGSEDKENLNSNAQELLPHPHKLENKAGGHYQKRPPPLQTQGKRLEDKFYAQKQINQNSWHSDEAEALIHPKSLELEVKTMKQTKTAAKRRIFQRVIPLKLLQPGKFHS